MTWTLSVCDQIPSWGGFEFEKETSDPPPAMLSPPVSVSLRRSENESFQKGSWVLGRMSEVRKHRERIWIVSNPLPPALSSMMRPGSPPSEEEEKLAGDELIEVLRKLTGMDGTDSVSGDGDDDSEALKGSAAEEFLEEDDPTAVSFPPPRICSLVLLPFYLSFHDFFSLFSFFMDH